MGNIFVNIEKNAALNYWWQIFFAFDYDLYTSVTFYEKARQPELYWF